MEEVVQYHALLWSSRILTTCPSVLSFIACWASKANEIYKRAANVIFLSFAVVAAAAALHLDAPVVAEYVCWIFNEMHCTGCVWKQGVSSAEIPLIFCTSRWNYCHVIEKMTCFDGKIKN